ncbi:leucyl-tRNA synthetase [Paragonimus westermani]|uniref:leucine--tRNA ligase n=1 Tax=Paragonimus westermani TaxID=34504 RepID=A0A5J4P055_9TREM|nr:leucyl-tRNA synthetase [Paragonimus westermani]
MELHKGAVTIHVCTRLFHVKTQSPRRIFQQPGFLRFRLLSSVSTTSQTLEQKWIPLIREHDRNRAKLWENVKKGRSYILSMFPYPSGHLHLGHLRVYTVADVLYRYQSMRGMVVLQPMGWDAFGLPAENAAIDRSVSPLNWTKTNISHMRDQMESTMLLGLDWSRELSTCNEEYYRWTQWLFLKLYQAGLAYHRLAFVNWDPVDHTVLADELVDAEGRSWRSGALVERRLLRQWFFRTTVYSEVFDCSDLFPFHLINANLRYDASVVPHLPLLKPENQRGINSSRKLVLCSHPLPNGGGLFRLCVASACAASPWPERLAITARHPFTNRLIPMIRQPQSKQPENAAFPDELCFALKGSNDTDLTYLFQLPPPPVRFRALQSSSGVEPVVDPADVSLNDLDNYTFVTSLAPLNGVRVTDTTGKALELLKSSKRGGHWTSELRTDWLVSRQRYWGTPIPIVHCRSCGIVPVPEDQLPVRLPTLDRPLNRGDAPLKDNAAWRHTECPQCGGPAERETDTLDTFVDSSWYYLRYLDPQNKQAICDPVKAGRGLPVDVYVGGMEHAIRHLYYARFMAHFLHDLGVIPCREPFLRFLPVGLVLGQTFVERRSGRFVAPSEACKSKDKNADSTWIERSTGARLNVTWDKMSKSKLNGVDPSEVVRRHGIELVRLTMLANVGPHRARKWQEDGVLRGLLGWQTKMARLVNGLIDFADTPHERGQWKLLFGPDDPLSQDPTDFCVLHERTIAQVNSYYNDSFVLSAVIARLQELTDLLRKTSRSSGGPGPTSFLFLRAMADLIVMLAPVAPIFACELWSGLQFVCLQKAPPSVQDVLTSLRVHDPCARPLHAWPYDLSKLALDQPFPLPSGENAGKMQPSLLADCAS